MPELLKNMFNYELLHKLAVDIQDVRAERGKLDFNLIE